MSLKYKHELLVPVGNFPSLIAAINNGADAVYLGGKFFGARAFAANFSYEELEDAVKLCHLYGVKIYVTVNTLIYDDEVESAISYIRFLHKIGVDALIMQDVGLINLTHQMFPNLEIHASTQMHNHSSESLKFLENLGIKRVVFGRELPLDYIENIKTPLEKEVFIHGSLCISYSGQCLFSSLALNRSGNRGECAGMCRLPYKLVEDESEIKCDGDYLLSPKDLTSISHFKELLDSDILCFKIEGRMKSPSYVGMVTKIYRNLIDQYNNDEPLRVSKEDLDTLASIYNREYTGGYLFNEFDIINRKSPNHQGLLIGHVLSITKKKIKIKLSYPLEQFSGIRFKQSDIGFNINFLYDEKDNLIKRAEKGKIVYLDNFVNLKTLDDVMLTNPVIKEEKEVVKKIPICLKLTAHFNDYLKILVTVGKFQVELKSTIKLDYAKKEVTSKERIIASLNKIGNTPFIINNLQIDLEDNLFIPMSILNNLRRDALEELKTLRENDKVLFEERKFKRELKKHNITHNINYLVRNKEQLQACLDKNIKNIIVTDLNLMQDNFIFKVLRDNIKHDYNYQNYLVTDYASLDKFPNNIGDYSLNITNHYTLDYLNNYAKCLMLSVENSAKDIKNIMANYHNDINVEVFIYGKVEVMIMKYCLLKDNVNKDKICHVCENNHHYFLKSNTNKMYPILNNRLTHGTTLFNNSTIDLINKMKDYQKLGITNFRIEFLDESYDEVIKVIERVEENE